MTAGIETRATIEWPQRYKETSPQELGTKSFLPWPCHEIPQYELDPALEFNDTYRHISALQDLG